MSTFYHVDKCLSRGFEKFGRYFLLDRACETPGVQAFDQPSSRTEDQYLRHFGDYRDIFAT